MLDHATPTIGHVDMSTAREKVQSDFDLERFIDMFDEALTSKDERVVNALRSLMMMVILTKPENPYQGHDKNNGPLRQLFEDLHHLNRRMYSMEETLRDVQQAQKQRVEGVRWDDITKYKMSQMDEDTIRTVIKQVNGGKI
jgi:hypothetical protein